MSADPTIDLIEILARASTQPKVIAKALDLARTQWRFSFVSRAGESLISEMTGTPEEADAMLTQLRQWAAELDGRNRARTRRSRVLQPRPARHVKRKRPRRRALRLSRPTLH